MNNTVRIKRTQLETLILRVCDDRRKTMIHWYSFTHMLRLTCDIKHLYEIIKQFVYILSH